MIVDLLKDGSLRFSYDVLSKCFGGVERRAIANERMC